MRGESVSTYPRRPKAGAFSNVVDVVERIHDPNDPSTERTTLPFSAYVQHDGVVTIMMFSRCRASPKLRDDMTEVEYGGGGHRTRLRNDP